MGLPLRPYITTGVTTGVALAGATALAITPVALPPLQEDRTIKISAHNQPETVERQVRLLSDSGFLEQFFNGEGLGGLLPDLGGLLPELPALDGLAGGLLDTVFVDLDTIDESFAAAFDEAGVVVAAELAILPSRLIHVATALGAGNPDAENHLLEGFILFALDAIHPLVHAGLNHLNPGAASAIHVAWDLIDMVARNFAAQWYHGVPGIYRPEIEEDPVDDGPEAEGAALSAGSSAITEGGTADDSEPAEQTVLQRVVSAGTGLGRFGKDIADTVTEELSGNGSSDDADPAADEVADDDSTDVDADDADPAADEVADDDSTDVDADEGSGVDDAAPEAKSGLGGEDSEDGQETDLDAQGSDSEDTDSEGLDGSDAESDQDGDDGTTPRLAKSFLDTTKGGKFTPRAIGNDAGPAGKKVFAAVTGGLSDAVKGFGERVKKFTGAGAGGDDSGADASGGDSGADSSGADSGADSSGSSD